MWYRDMARSRHMMNANTTFTSPGERLDPLGNVDRGTTRTFRSSECLLVNT